MRKVGQTRRKFDNLTYKLAETWDRRINDISDNITFKKSRVMVRCSCVRVFVCSCVRVFVCSCVRVFVCSCVRCVTHA